MEYLIKLFDFIIKAITNKLTYFKSVVQSKKLVYQFGIHVGKYFIRELASHRLDDVNTLFI